MKTGTLGQENIQKAIGGLEIIEELKINTHPGASGYSHKRLVQAEFAIKEGGCFLIGEDPPYASTDEKFVAINGNS